MILLPLPPEAWPFMHLPLCTSSPLLNAQFWAAPALQDQIWILFRSAELLPVSSAHLPP